MPCEQSLSCLSWQGYQLGPHARSLDYESNNPRTREKKYAEERELVDRTLFFFFFPFFSWSVDGEQERGEGRRKKKDCVCAPGCDPWRIISQGSKYGYDARSGPTWYQRRCNWDRGGVGREQWCAETKAGCGEQWIATSTMMVCICQ